jgi:diguanylate cyclase (GGDEF)-like protein
MASNKVENELIVYAYKQMGVGLLASVCCGGLIFVGLFSSQRDNGVLITWFGFFLAVLVLRVTIVHFYFKQVVPENNLNLWRRLFIGTAVLAGLSWGILGLILLPYVSAPEQIFLILIEAGVSAAVIPLMSAVPAAAIAFLVSCIGPFIFSTLFLINNLYGLFGSALIVYLIYSIILTLKAYRLVKNSIALTFENDALLMNLSAATHQLELINHRLEESATHDPLTKIANRTLFKEKLDRAIHYACLHKKNIAVFYIDLDHFKQINDQYGHEAGDEVLLTVTSRLRHFFRKTDIVSRWGGDELTVVLDNIDNPDQVKKIADTLCETISIPIKLKDRELHVHSSIGISIYPEDGENAEALLNYADQMMYLAKAQGGNRVCSSREPVV